MSHPVYELPPMPLHNLLICCGPGPCHPACPVAVWAGKHLEPFVSIGPQAPTEDSQR